MAGHMSDRASEEAAATSTGVGGVDAEFPFGVGTTAELTVRGTPRPQGSFKALISKSTNRAFAKPSGNYTEWRNIMVTQMATMLAAGELPEFGDGPLELDAMFVLARPKGHPKRRAASDGGVVYNGADLDKLVRTVCDALTVAGVIGDDTQITRIVAMKVYDGSGHIEAGGHDVSCREGVSLRLRRMPGGYVPGSATRMA